MKLIVENVCDECRIVKEANHDPSKPETLIVEGVYAQSCCKNGNGRVYPYEVLAQAVDEFQAKIKSNQALEELEHPEVTSIQPDRVCARTLSLVEDNKSWVGRSVVLASDPKFGIKGTPCGDILKSLIQFDCAFGHSTRGVGNVNEKTNEVEEYQMICIDTVLSPSIGIMNQANGKRVNDVGLLESTRSAYSKLLDYKNTSKYVNGILESKDFMIDMHGDIVESTYSKLGKKLSKMPNTHISSKKAEYVGKALNDFFSSLV